jgi:hypothetical protein
MKKLIAISLTFSIGAALLVWLVLSVQVDSVQANPGILYVAPDGICGGTTPNCYASIQAAVDEAAPNDEILVAAGVYTDVYVRPRNDTTSVGVVTQTVYISKTVTIRGGYSPDFSARDLDVYSTTLDAQGQGRGLYITGNINPTVEGLHITGGDAAGLGGYAYAGTHDAGGGVYVLTAAAALIDNQIYGNTAPYAGGVFVGSSTGRLDNNKIFNNTATNAGGLFLYQGSASLYGNTIISNTSTNIVGGVYLFSTNATLTRNRIAGNSANTIGGGIDVASCSPTFDSNIITGNAAGRGGGVYLWYSHSTFTNNVIADNQASISGSGLWTGGSQPRLLYTTIARNTGGDGSGVFVSDAGSTHSTLAMSNTILVSHAVGVSVTAGSTATLDGVLWYNTPITVSQVAATVMVKHQYTGDPLFDVDGYHLTSGSAAIDKGVPLDVHSDIDGQPRPSGLFDLGADEYWPPGSLKYVYLPIIFRNH